MQENSTVVDRFSRVTPETFQRELADRWVAIDAIKDKLVPIVGEQVSARRISPVEGLGIFSCLTAQLLGYAQFHGNATGADMLTALQPALERDPELASR